METAHRTAAKIRRYSEVVKRRHLLAIQRSSAHNIGCPQHRHLHSG